MYEAGSSCRGTSTSTAGPFKDFIGKSNFLEVAVINTLNETYLNLEMGEKSADLKTRGPFKVEVSGPVLEFPSNTLIYESIDYYC